MSEVQQQNDIMVFDEEDDLIKPAKEDFMKPVEQDDITQPPETLLTEDEPPVEEDAPPIIEEPKQEEVEEESLGVPETVEDVAPLVQLDEPLIPEVKEEEKPQINEEVEDVKPVVAPPVPVEDIIEQPPSKESVVDARVIDLVHWRDVKQSATVLCFLLLVLGSLTSYSIISVCSYTGLTLLTVTMAFRIYKLALQTINGTQQPHPFQYLLDYDLNISEEQVHKYADSLFKYTNSFLQSARALLLVENVVNSLKFAVCLWLVTFIGCCFNGLTLVITGVLLAFSVPPVYEKYQQPIDQNIALVNEKVGAVWSKVQAKIPALKPKTE